MDIYTRYIQRVYSREKLVNIEILVLNVLKSKIVMGLSGCWKGTIVPFVSLIWIHSGMARRSS